jgi:2-phospho-L-lactate guanylyltransferase (CobY/MobA/RfbA family)
MQSLNDDERKEVLGEVLADELKAIHELVQDIPEIKKDVNKIKVDVEDLKSDMQVVKAAVTDQTKQLKDHELRIIGLEAA